MSEAIAIYFAVGFFVTIAFVAATFDTFQQKANEQPLRVMVGAVILIWLVWPSTIIVKWFGPCK